MMTYRGNRYTRLSESEVQFILMRSSHWEVVVIQPFDFHSHVFPIRLYVQSCAWTSWNRARLDVFLLWLQLPPADSISLVGAHSQNLIATSAPLFYHVLMFLFRHYFLSSRIGPLYQKCPTVTPKEMQKETKRHLNE